MLTIMIITVVTLALGIICLYAGYTIDNTVAVVYQLLGMTLLVVAVSLAVVLIALPFIGGPQWHITIH